LGILGTDERILLKCVLEKCGVKKQTGLKWLGIRSDGGLL
jgi:hypothetical protein